MTMEAIKLTKAQAHPIVKETFPDYRGRKFTLKFQERVTFYDTNWGGGTRNKYAFIRSDGVTAVFNAPAPWINPVEGQTMELPQDVMIVEHSIFCGKDCGITIYAHPSHLPKWLPSA